MKRVDWTSPYVVMWVVIGMYILKATGKLWLGNTVHSPVLVGDGTHNIADIAEAGFVMVAVRLLRRPPKVITATFAYGWRSIESVVQLAIGGGLLWMALHTVAEAAAAALAFAPDFAARFPIPLPQYEPLRVESQFLPWVVLATGGAGVVSLLVSRYQLHVGRATGHENIADDGEETKSDARIEIVACIGMLAEYAWHAHWVEYPLACIVAALIGRTGWEIGTKGWRRLMQGSIGSSHEASISTALKDMPGVVGVAELITFHIGSAVHVNVKILTRASTAQCVHMKHAIHELLADYLDGQGFREYARYVRFGFPDPDAHREAYAVRRAGPDAVIAPSLHDATHLRICDIAHEDIVRWEDVPIPGQLARVVALLVEKRCHGCWVTGTECDGVETYDVHEQYEVESAGIHCLIAPSAIPENLGM